MKAWQLFKSRKNWCQGTYARDKNGMEVDSQDSTAVSFCATGALRKIYGENTNGYFNKEMLLHNYIGSNTRFFSSIGWNDHENQRWGRVKAMLKRLDV